MSNPDIPLEKRVLTAERLSEDLAEVGYQVAAQGDLVIVTVGGRQVSIEVTGGHGQIKTGLPEGANATQQFIRSLGRVVSKYGLFLHSSGGFRDHDEAHEMYRCLLPETISRINIP